MNIVQWFSDLEKFPWIWPEATHSKQLRALDASLFIRMSCIKEYQRIKFEWCTHTSAICAIFVSDYGLSPAQHKTNIWTHTCLMLVGSLVTRNKLLITIIKIRQYSSNLIRKCLIQYRGHYFPHIDILVTHYSEIYTNILSQCLSHPYNVFWYYGVYVGPVGFLGTNIRRTNV